MHATVVSGLRGVKKAAAGQAPDFRFRVALNLTLDSFSARRPHDTRISRTPVCNAAGGQAAVSLHEAPLHFLNTFSSGLDYSSHRGRCTLAACKSKCIDTGTNRAGFGQTARRRR